MRAIPLALLVPLALAACGRSPLYDMGGAGASGQGGAGVGGRGGGSGGQGGRGGQGGQGGMGGASGWTWPGESLSGCADATPGDTVTLGAFMLTDASWFDDRFGVTHAVTNGESVVATFGLEGKGRKSITLPTGATAARIAGATDRFGVAWIERAAVSPRLFFRAVNADLKALDDDIPITTPSDLAQLALAWNGRFFGLVPGKIAQDLFLLDESGNAKSIYPVGTMLATILPGRPLVGVVNGFAVLRASVCDGEPCIRSLELDEDGKAQGQIDLPRSSSVAAGFNANGGNVMGALLDPDIAWFDESGVTEVLAQYANPSSEIDVAWVGGDAFVAAWSGVGQKWTTYTLVRGGKAQTWTVDGLPGGAKRVRVIAASDSVGIFVGDSGSGPGTAITKYVRLRCGK